MGKWGWGFKQRMDLHEVPPNKKVPSKTVIFASREEKPQVVKKGENK